MNAVRPETYAAEPPRRVRELVRELAARAHRLEAVVADGRWFLESVRPATGWAPECGGHVITVAPPTESVTRFWRWTRIAEPPAPEFILFYRDGSSFPDCALLFAGAAGAEAWVTVHRQPLALHRLRARFRDLAASASARPPGPGARVAASIREERLKPPRAGDAEATNEPPQLVAADELYRRVLAAHFSDAPVPADQIDRPAASPTLAAHQRRAYERACDILDRYGGVIVADAVGLGKTYVGLRLIERALDAGGRALIIVPAALREQWQRELAYLGGDGEASDIAVTSVEALGRRSFDPARAVGAELVLIDEAHNFRNPATRRYRNLASLVRHSQVALLTATPINNTVLDLQHLIDLFAPPGAFRHLGIADYRRVFRSGDAQNPDLRKIISACVLRRTRRFLREQYGEILVSDRRSNRAVTLRFPERPAPKPVEYDLAATYGDLFERLDECLSELRFEAFAEADAAQEETGAAQVEESSEPGDGRASSAELLKIILLKRLESSIEAFKCTVVQQIAWCSTALRAIESGRVLTRPDYRATFRGPADDPGSQLAFFELMLPAPTCDPQRIAEFRRSLESDLQILMRVHRSLIAVGPRGDRKLQRLIELIDGPHAGKKILIFTEFLDTARYIHRRLRDRPYLGQIDSGSARLGQDRAARQEVIERFAPHSNGVPEPPARERVDVLIATDVLSEGLNLQDASVVVSYDLPWNPVRLMQRFGRIDRLGALAERVELHHFVPARDLERLLGLMERLRRKVTTIGSALGLDGAVLAGAGADSHREAEQLRILVGNPDGYRRIEEQVEGPLDPEEQAYIDFAAHAAAGGSMPAATDDAGPVVGAVSDDASIAVRAAAYWQIRVGERRRSLWLIYDPDARAVIEDQAGALELMRNARAATSREAPADVLEVSRRAFGRYAYAVAARLEAGRHAGEALSPTSPQCRIAAQLSRRLRESRRQLTDEERARLDRLLDRLGRRFTVAAERSLAEFAHEPPAGADDRRLDRLEDLLSATESERLESPSVRETATLLLLSPNNEDA